MPVQLFNDNHKKLYNHISEDLKLKNKRNEKYSIFGHHIKAMDFAYVPISNVERNNKGLYTESYNEPSYYNEGLQRSSHQSMSVPVWLLPFANESSQREIKPKVEKQIEPIVTQPIEEKQTEQIANQPVDNNQAEQDVEQLAIAQRVEPTNVLYEKTFTWPYGGEHVVLTGDFDKWQESIEMSPVISNNKTVFSATVSNLDPTKDTEYKFVVDGNWYYDMNADIIEDEAGNINNIIHADK